ncbi:MAG: hypothetical protein AB9873_14220 [Syntrophobacteraceae bacterium]
MRSLIVWVGLLMVSAICGCAAVYATKPVGDVPCPVKPAEWDGTWVNKDGALTLKVQDEQAGRLRMAWVEWSLQGPRLESQEIQLLRSGDATFASVKEGEDNGRARYVWARIKREGNEMICWIPDVEHFRAAGRSGQFPFEEKDDSIILGELTPEHLKTLASPEAGLLYRWDDPVVLLRMNSGEN